MCAFALNNMFKKKVATEFNCGYARVAVKHLAKTDRGKQDYDKQSVEQNFKEAFDSEHFKLPDGYFERPPKKKLSPFEQCTKEILTQKWNPMSARALARFQWLTGRD